MNDFGISIGDTILQKGKYRIVNNGVNYSVQQQIYVGFIFKKNIWIEIKSFWNYKNTISLLEVLISNDV